MLKEDLDAIAQLRTYCEPFGESVRLSRVERDELVALARDGMRFQFVLNDACYGYPSSEGSQYEEVYLVVTGTQANDQEHALRIIDAAMAKEGA